MAGFRIEGDSSGYVAEVDSEHNIRVVLSNNDSKSGSIRPIYNPGSTVYRYPVFTDEGSTASAFNAQMFDLQWNTGTTATWPSKIGTNATTMTKQVNNGYMRLNQSAITTTTTGIAIYSNRTFSIENGRETIARMYARHNNGAATSKQIDLGFGYYAFAAGQAAAMNEFIGFRWTTAGGLQCVVETSQGGAPGAQTVNINGNVPYADAITNEYKLNINKNNVLFFVNDAWVATIARDPATYSVIKGVSLPFIARIFNSGAASAACTFDIGTVSVIRMQGEARSAAELAVSMGRSSYYNQPDLLNATTATHVVPASGTAPTANVGSNTASAFNATTAQGGWYRNTLTGVTVTAHTNVLVAAYQNPPVPTAAGVATNARNFYVTGLQISAQVVTTALTGGGYTAAWFAGIGATATTLATTDADGTTAVAQKAMRLVPLNLITTLPATAAAGVTSTDVGDHQFTFPTPLCIHPGEFLHIGFRTLFVTAAVTAGAVDGCIGVNGYWE